jgi:hypothetical protein
MTGNTKYRPVGKKPSPVWGSIYDQRKIPLHLFTIGFQKQMPGFRNPMVKRCNGIFL